VALILRDRVKVNTTTTGTGTVVLNATPPTGYQSFAVIGDNNTTYYTIAGQTSAEWEVGIGTYYLANSSLSRDTILSSSAANAAVTFGVGTKDVFVTYPASQSVNEDATGNVSSYNFLGGSINNMTIGATTANTIAGTTLSLNNVFTSTYTGSATSGATQIYLNGATSNRIDFNQNGTAAPSVTTRSAGTKIVYYPGISAAQTEYAAGIESNTLWHSIPSSANQFKWYANTTAVATLLGTGVLSTTGGFSGNGANLTALSASSITTGGLNNIPVGNTTPSTGAFTTLTASGNVNLDAGTFFVDATNNLVGVNTSAPASRLASVVNFGNGTSTNFLAQANGTALSQTAGYSFRSTFGNTADFAPRRSADIWSGFNAGNWGTEYLAFGVGSNGAGNDVSNITSEKMRIDATGNVAVDTNTLFVDGVNNRVGLGTTTPANTLSVTGNASITQLLTVGANAALGGATNPIVAQTGNANNFIQSYIYNLGNLSQSSSDIVVYPHNGTDVKGFVDMGINSLAFNQAAYAVTGPNEGYIFMSAPANTSSGNLVFATDSTGSINAMQFYTGGFAQAKSNASMTLSNAGALTVKGPVILGNSTIQNSAGNLVFTTGGANVTAFSIDQNQVSTFNGTIEEKVTVSATAAAANVNFDAVTQNILFYTSNATANTTINLRGSATIPLNNVMANGQSISLVFMNTQGNTAYYVDKYQIDGVGITPKWQGNSAPNSGNARGIDVYSFTAIKTANATFTVLASQTQFA